MQTLRWAFFAITLMSVGCDADPSTFVVPAPPAPQELEDHISVSWATWLPGRVHANLRHDGHFGNLHLAVDGRRLTDYDPSGAGATGRGFNHGEPTSFDALLPLSQRPRVVDVVNDAGQTVAEIPVTDPELLADGDVCSPNTARTRCAAGSLCAYPDPVCPEGLTACSPDGICSPVEVTAFRSKRQGLSEELVIQLVGPPRQSNIFAGSGAPDASVERLRVDERQLYGRDPFGDPLPGGPQVDIYQNFIPVALDVAVVSTVERGIGEACDALEIESKCAGEAVCAGGVCTPRAAPELDTVRVFYDQGWLAVMVDGTDTNRDVRHVRVLPMGGGLFTFVPGIRAYADHVSSQITWQADDFALFGSIEADDPPTDEVCVRVEDNTGLTAETCVFVELEPPRTPVEIDELCDVGGMIQRCPNATWCSATTVDSRLMCRPATECIDLIFEPATLRLDEPTSTDDTALGSFGVACSLGHGLSGRYFEFVAPTDGLFRFASSESTADFSIRQQCELVHSTLGCAEGAAFLDVELLAGERVTLVFDWARHFFEPADVWVTQL